MPFREYLYADPEHESIGVPCETVSKDNPG